MGRSRQTPEDWARQVELRPPVRWAAVEDEILDCAPTVEQTSADKVVRGIGFVLTSLVAIPTFGAAAVALALLFLGAEGALVNILLVLAIGTPIAMLVVWWSDDRDRGPVKIVVAGGSGLLCALAYLAMRAGTVAGSGEWTSLFALAGAVVGLGGAVVMLVGANADHSRPRRRRWSLSPAKDIAYVRARRRALEILVERGQVALGADEVKRMSDMPLGTWHTLDASSRQ